MQKIYKQKITSKMQIFDWQFSAPMGMYWSSIFINLSVATT